MKEPLDKNKLGKGREIPDVTYSVIEHLGYDTKDKKQRKIGTITQKQFIDLQDEMELVDKDYDKLKLIDEKSGELLLECKVSDKIIQYLLEVGLNTILESFVDNDEWMQELEQTVADSPWENNLDEE